jgi:hypothetical protein
MFHMEVKKEPKIRMGANRRIFFWGQKWKLTPVRPIHLAIQKEKSLTWKHLSKIGRQNFHLDSNGIKEDGRATEIFFS